MGFALMQTKYFANFELCIRTAITWCRREFVPCENETAFRSSTEDEFYSMVFMISISMAKGSQ